MPRGRPRKNPLPTVDAVTTNSTEEVAKEVSIETTKTDDSNEMGTEVNVSSKGKPKKDDTPRCVCCKEPVYSGRRLNLSLLTTLAPYHFEIEETQPYICGKCAMNLGEVINKWLIKHGATVKPYCRASLKEDNSNG